ncbi:MAG: KamA family radical SAM protein [Dehalococcoidia bacterium]|nr:KamA family radical SAM protein [Dehalococcoidia bacterium]
MKTLSASLKTCPVLVKEGRSQDSFCADEVDEEPPGKPDDIKNLEDEPPSSNHRSHNNLFGEVPEKLWKDWKWHFRNRITTVEQLNKFIPLTPEEQAQVKLVSRLYPLAVTPYYLSLINPDDPEDPIRKQAIPSILEVTMGAVGFEDPLAEKEDTVVPGLVHRYPDRALIVITDICSMLCRHCTRKREWRKGGWVRTDDEIEAILDYLRKNKSVRDVIISGGDPLTLSSRRLGEILAKLRAINHIEIIRIGTRFPVVLPQRIDSELCAMLSQYGPIWLNTHFNHVREITPEAAEACDRIIRSGTPVNNQSVLLRGINDTVKTQLELCRGLLRIKVRPYYLFQCDEVQGTEHLRTPVETGTKIIEGMRGFTSGLALPTFVVDLPNGGGKVPLQPDYILSKSDTELVLKNYEGHVYHYRNPEKGCPEANSWVTGSPLERVEKIVVEQEVTHVSKVFEDADRVIVRS